MIGRQGPNPPEKLYKFCAFSARSLDLLNRQRIYYSDPATFNDPLDCNPTIQENVPTNDLVRLCHTWESVNDQEDPIGKGLPPEHRSLDEAGDGFYRRELAYRLTRMLREELGVYGVLSLTAKWDSPLMWSHYADQHRGICIEYDTTKLAHHDLRAVIYGAPRSISAGDLLRWKVDRSPEAEALVRRAYFFSKAADWSYEKKWRYVYHRHGEDAATLQITGIYFGVRCPPIVRSIFIRVLQPETVFREVFPKRDSFELASRILNPSEEVAMAQGSSAYLDFAEQMEIAKNEPG